MKIIKIMKNMFHNTIRQDILRMLFMNLSKRIEKDDEPRDFVDAVERSNEDDEPFREFIEELLFELFCTWCELLFLMSLTFSDPIEADVGDIPLFPSAEDNTLEVIGSDLLLTARFIDWCNGGVAELELAFCGTNKILSTTLWPPKLIHYFYSYEQKTIIWPIPLLPLLLSMVSSRSIFVFLSRSLFPSVVASLTLRIEEDT